MFVWRRDNGMASKFYVKNDEAFLKKSKKFLYVKNFVKKWMHWRNIVVAVPVAATVVVFSMAAFQKTIVVYPVHSTSSANSSSRDNTFPPLANKTPSSVSSMSVPSVNPKAYNIQPVQKIVVVHTTVIPTSIPTADTTVTTVATATATATVTKIVYENNNPTLSATATNTSSTERPTGLSTAGSAPTATPTSVISDSKSTAVNSSIKNTSASQSIQSESSATSSASQNSVLSIK